MIPLLLDCVEGRKEEKETNGEEEEDNYSEWKPSGLGFDIFTISI